MSEVTLNLTIENAYAKLRQELLENKCKIEAETPPTYILAKQGSLNGITPKSAKKKITYQLTQEANGNSTKITATTIIAKDWTCLTLYGNILAAAIVGMFLWIASDIENYILTNSPGFWTWLGTAYGLPDPSRALFMASMTRVLAFFLIATIAVEILIVLYVYPRKNITAQQALQKLKSQN